MGARARGPGAGPVRLDGYKSQFDLLREPSGNGTTTTAFADMGLSEPSMRAIEEELGFTHATSVQDQTLVGPEIWPTYL